MAEHVEARGGVYGGGHGAGIERVANSEGRLEVAVRDAGFGTLGDEVENSGAGCFRASAGRGWNGDEGEEGFAYGKTFAQGSIDEVEKVVVFTS